MFRANSTSRQLFAHERRDAIVELIEHCIGAIDRILPHVKVSAWTQRAWEESDSVWANTDRTEIRITVGIGSAGRVGSQSFEARVSRQIISGFGYQTNPTLDNREGTLCKLIVEGVSEVANNAIRGVSVSWLKAYCDIFDEQIVARHVKQHHALQLDLSSVLEALRTLSEQSYENKALSFGCLLNPNDLSAPTSGVFPSGFLRAKKYKALSDGYRTAYEISSYGKVLGLIDLDDSDQGRGQHYFPDWAKGLAACSVSEKCGIALNRQGDISIFEDGTLRFTYRFGHWQYWNHSHLVRLLRDTARAQHVEPSVLGRVVGTIYRAALDVSFRRSGGLFVIVHNVHSLHKIVRQGDAIGDNARDLLDHEFDDVVRDKKIFQLPRSLVVELASLDGAIVLANSGKILAYGAVLQPRRKGQLKGSEGSRTKAAIGASNYGLAVKISSDGDISVYDDGKEFIKV